MNAFRETVDPFIAGLTLICLMPVLVILTAIVRLGSPGPILVSREFARQDGSRSLLYRFHTTQEDGAKTSVAGRILRRLHLDLLPVLWNVVRGDLPMTDIVLVNRMWR